MKPNEPTPIICGTDFSENAAHAATAAAVLAALSGKPLLLVHAADEFNGRGDDQKNLKAFLRPVTKQLRTEANRLKKTGATVEIKVLTGQAAELAIKEFGRERAASLTVVSSVSKTAFDRWTLGSVSEQLAQVDPVPTLVVRSAAPFEAWERGERPLKIFVAADLASVSEAALQWVRDLRALGPCDIVVAQVDRPQEECERLGIVTTALKNPTTVQRVLERDLRKRVHALLGKENVRIVVEPARDRPDARLIELAVEAHTDMIVVGTHQRRGLGRVGHPSFSRGILRHAPMSVACVPAAFAPKSRHIPVIQRVLVATDFSKFGDCAVPHAYSLLPAGGTVFLLHISEPMPNPLALNLNPKIEKAIKPHQTRLRKTSARLLALIPSEAANRDGASEIAVVEDTDPARAICQAAERFGADVICIGSHGRSGLSAMVMGSVAQAVMAQSSRPVLVVRPPAE